MRDSMGKPMKSHYFGHDAAYQYYKKSGRPGWSDEQTTRENIKELSTIIGRLQPLPGAKILELGCGAGNLSLELARRGFQVTGVDISPAAIDWAHENAASAASIVHKPTFRVGNVLELPEVYTNFFDYVLDGYCLHCIIGDDRPIFLNQAFRVLRPFGALHIATMCNDYKGALSESYDAVSRCTVINGIGTRYFGTAESILAEIKTAGFTPTFSVVECDSSSAQEMLRVDCRKRS